VRQLLKSGESMQMSDNKKYAQEHYHSFNRSNNCRDMAICRFVKMAAVRHIELSKVRHFNDYYA